MRGTRCSVSAGFMAVAFAAAVGAADASAALVSFTVRAQTLGSAELTGLYGR
jgi:hypothetical protein